MSTDKYVPGVMNLTGVRPGHAHAYDGPMMSRMLYYSLTFTSTHDAIQRLVLPPPLEVDRDEPPKVNLTFFVNAENRAFDGMLAPYQAVLFTARARYGDHAGAAGWEFVDATHGDRTEMDVLLPWGAYYGMLKKLADIRCLPVNGDEWEFSATRRGVRLVTGRFKLCFELDREALDELNSDRIGMFGVREIPNVDFTGFIDRSVIWSDPFTTTIMQAWKLENLGIKLGHGELDPLDELPVLELNEAIAMRIQVSKENQSRRRVLAELPRV